MCMCDFIITHPQNHRRLPRCFNNYDYAILPNSKPPVPSLLLPVTSTCWCQTNGRHETEAVSEWERQVTTVHWRQNDSGRISYRNSPGKIYNFTTTPPVTQQLGLLVLQLRTWSMWKLNHCNVKCHWFIFDSSTTFVYSLLVNNLLVITNLYYKRKLFSESSIKSVQVSESVSQWIKNWFSARQPRKYISQQNMAKSQNKLEGGIISTQRSMWASN